MSGESWPEVTGTQPRMEQKKTTWEFSVFFNTEKAFLHVNQANRCVRAWSRMVLLATLNFDHLGSEEQNRNTSYFTLGHASGNRTNPYKSAEIRANI